MTTIAVPPSLEIDLNVELTEGFTARYIRGKVRRLVRHAAMRHHDKDDLQQELTAAVCQALPSFDPAVGDWESFVSTVIERRAGQLLIGEKREKRLQGNAASSLDVLVKDADGVDVPLATQIRPEHQSAVTRQYRREDQEWAELLLDLETHLASLPDDERTLLLQLAKKSQAAVARARGVSRRTIRDLLERVRSRIMNPEELSENHQKPTARSSANRKA